MKLIDFVKQITKRFFSTEKGFKVDSKSPETTVSGVSFHNTGNYRGVVVKDVEEISGD